MYRFYFLLLFRSIFTSVRSWNQLTFCASALWNSDGQTFSNSSQTGTSPNMIFIDKQNTFYISSDNSSDISIGKEENSSWYRSLASNLTNAHGLFVVSEDAIYIDNGAKFGQVEQWSINTNKSTIVMTVNSSCYSLFIGPNDTLYCSLSDLHQVVAITLNTSGTLPIVLAGNGISGSASNELSDPRGIFVTEFNDFYVADCGNNRIQLFRSGQLSALTVISNITNSPIDLQCPTGILFDNDEYIYILEQNNHRIIRSDFKNYQCIVGCSGVNGNAANQLNSPSSFALDKNGNFWIIDRGNSRLQKFILARNSCHLMHNLPRFSPCVRWNPIGTTFANSSIVGTKPLGFFIDLNDTIYVAARTRQTIIFWSKTNVTHQSMSISSQPARAVTVGNNGEIYVDNLNNTDVWTKNSSQPSVAMRTMNSCYGLFIDIKENLYCSVYDNKYVIKKSFMDSINITTIVADSQTPNGAAVRLERPAGIFVDFQLNLYVADPFLNRILRYAKNNLTAVVVAGNGAANTIDLTFPTGVFLDADGYLFISDQQGHRIVGSGPLGFRCIVGCQHENGSNSNQLHSPYSFAFDSDGNLFVCDAENHRIQRFELMRNSCLPSLNEPKLCPTASWDSNALVLLNETHIGSDLLNSFVNRNNTIYVASPSLQRGQRWSNENGTFDRSFMTHINAPYAIVTDSDGNIYIDNGARKKSIDQWNSNVSPSVSAMSISDSCFSLFVDILDNLYCSMTFSHQILRHALNENVNTTIIIAGNGTNGSTVALLNNPRGIFVDHNLTLYVADCFNNRIQVFHRNQRHGSTVTITDSIHLNRPTAVVLDANGYLFITDSCNHRIIGSGPYGFRCIINCISTSVTGAFFSTPMNRPQSLNFDVDGNLIVIDGGGKRLLKFLLFTNSCMTNLPSLSVTTEFTPTTVVSSTSSVCDAFLSHFSSSTISTVEISIEVHNVTTETSTSSSLQQSSSSSASWLTTNVFSLSVNISMDPCEILKPCQNNGTCNRSSTQLTGYICSCPMNFNGLHCENDNRPCQLDTCRNAGTCETLVNNTYLCHCSNGWRGLRCETRIDLCQEIQCLNDGVCRSTFLNFTCECLGENYSGRLCEKVNSRTKLLQTVSTSFSYVSIVILTSFAILIITMDILKYVFKIDPVSKAKGKAEAKKKLVQKEKFVWAIKYKYIP